MDKSHPNVGKGPDANSAVFWALSHLRIKDYLQGCAKEALSLFPDHWWPGDEFRWLSVHPLHPLLFQNAGLVSRCSGRSHSGV